MQSRFNFPRYTYNDYKNWKEDWELIEGYPLQFLPSATIKHNLVQLNFVFQAKASLQSIETDCNCLVLSEVDWKISEDTVVRPDMMVVCDTIETEFLEFPPMLILEILSPSSLTKDRIIKFKIYQEQGVKYYLMVNYLKKTIEVYELINNQYIEVDKNKFKLNDTCEISFDYKKIWQ